MSKRSDIDNWWEDWRQRGWEMPTAPWWKTLPVIRHLRAAYLSVVVARHNAVWQARGKIPTGYDQWFLSGIAQGRERVQTKGC